MSKKARIKELKAEITALHAELVYMGSENYTLSNISQVVQAENDELISANRTHLIRNDELLIKIVNLRTELEAVRNANAELRTSLRDITAVNGKLRTTLQELSAENDDIKHTFFTAPVI